MSYIYETHLHTLEASKCGRVHGADYIDYMMEQGYNGIIVTDHFFNGNSGVPRELPWDERVKMYVSGYEAAKEAARDRDFDVLFGIEFNFNGDEYLIYGVDEEWLHANPDLLRKDRYQIHTLVNEAGGIMVQAHPYRERYYLDTIFLTPKVCDGIEIYNAANDPNMNALAYKYAKELDVPMSAGSDIHFFYDGQKGGMMFDRRIETIEDYVEAFKNREGTPVVVEGPDKIKKVEDMEELTVPTHSPTFPVVYF